MNTKRIGMAAVAGGLWLAGASLRASDAPAQARAAIEPRSGSTVMGTATFTELPSGGGKVVVKIEKAPPGTHGLHIHEKGDCSDPEAKSAGRWLVGGWHVTVAYVVGFFVMLAVLGWHPDPPR